MDVARDISEGLACNVLAAKVNGQVWDAGRVLPGDCDLQLLTWNDGEGKSTFWHSSAHLLAEALEALSRGQVRHRSPIENGFYYDVDLGDRTLSEHEFPAIEKKMLELARKGGLRASGSAQGGGHRLLSGEGDEYKLELIDELKDGEITFTNKANSPTCAAVRTSRTPASSRPPRC